MRRQGPGTPVLSDARLLEAALGAAKAEPWRKDALSFVHFALQATQTSTYVLLGMQQQVVSAAHTITPNRDQPGSVDACFRVLGHEHVRDNLDASKLSLDDLLECSKRSIASIAPLFGTQIILINPSTGQRTTQPWQPHSVVPDIAARPEGFAMEIIVCTASDALRVPLHAASTHIATLRQLLADFGTGPLGIQDEYRQALVRCQDRIDHYERLCGQVLPTFPPHIEPKDPAIMVVPSNPCTAVVRAVGTGDQMGLLRKHYLDAFIASLEPTCKVDSPLLQFEHSKQHWAATVLVQMSSPQEMERFVAIFSQLANQRNEQGKALPARRAHAAFIVLGALNLLAPAALFLRECLLVRGTAKLTLPDMPVQYGTAFTCSARKKKVYFSAQLPNVAPTPPGDLPAHAPAAATATDVRVLRLCATNGCNRVVDKLDGTRCAECAEESLSKSADPSAHDDEDEDGDEPMPDLPSQVPDVLVRSSPPRRDDACSKCSETRFISRSFKCPAGHSICARCTPTEPERCGGCLWRPDTPTCPLCPPPAVPVLTRCTGTVCGGALPICTRCYRQCGLCKRSLCTKCFPKYASACDAHSYADGKGPAMAELDALRTNPNTLPRILFLLGQVEEVYHMYVHNKEVDLSKVHEGYLSLVMECTKFGVPSDTLALIDDDTVDHLTLARYRGDAFMTKLIMVLSQNQKTHALAVGSYYRRTLSDEKLLDYDMLIHSLATDRKWATEHRAIALTLVSLYFHCANGYGSVDNFPFSTGMTLRKLAIDLMNSDRRGKNAPLVKSHGHRIAELLEERPLPTGLMAEPLWEEVLRVTIRWLKERSNIPYYCYREDPSTPVSENVVTTFIPGGYWSGHGAEQQKLFVLHSLALAHEMSPLHAHILQVLIDSLDQCAATGACDWAKDVPCAITFFKNYCEPGGMPEDICKALDTPAAAVPTPAHDALLTRVILWLWSIYGPYVSAAEPKAQHLWTTVHKDTALSTCAGCNAQYCPWCYDEDNGRDKQWRKLLGSFEEPMCRACFAKHTFCAKHPHIVERRCTKTPGCDAMHCAACPDGACRVQKPGAPYLEGKGEYQEHFTAMLDCKWDLDESDVLLWQLLHSLYTRVHFFGQSLATILQEGRLNGVTGKDAQALRTYIASLNQTPNTTSELCRFIDACELGDAEGKRLAYEALELAMDTVLQHCASNIKEPAPVADSAPVAAAAVFDSLFAQEEEEEQRAEPVSGKRKPTGGLKRAGEKPKAARPPPMEEEEQEEEDEQDMPTNWKQAFLALIKTQTQAAKNQKRLERKVDNLISQVDKKRAKKGDADDDE